MFFALALAAAPPRFDAIRFFNGRTEGMGRLRVAFHKPVAVRVHGHGHVERDGALVLEQRVEEGDKPGRDRTWRIAEVAPGRYRGTLSDATGPVTGEMRGDELRLRFHSSGGIAIEQRLHLAPDGRAAANRLTARKLGIVVARLDETIRKVD